MLIFCRTFLASCRMMTSRCRTAFVTNIISVCAAQSHTILSHRRFTVFIEWRRFHRTAHSLVDYNSYAYGPTVVNSMSCKLTDKMSSFYAHFICHVVPLLLQFRVEEWNRCCIGIDRRSFVNNWSNILWISAFPTNKHFKSKVEIRDDAMTCGIRPTSVWRGGQVCCRVSREMPLPSMCGLVSFSTWRPILTLSSILLLTENEL